MRAHVEAGLVTRYVAHVNFLDNRTFEVVLDMETITSTRYQVVREVSSCQLTTWHGGDDVGLIPSTCCTIVRGGVRTQTDDLREMALRCKVAGIKRLRVLCQLPQQGFMVRSHFDPLEQLLSNLLF